MQLESLQLDHGIKLNQIKLLFRTMLFVHMVQNCFKPYARTNIIPLFLSWKQFGRWTAYCCPLNSLRGKGPAHHPDVWVVMFQIEPESVCSKFPLMAWLRVYCNRSSIIFYSLLLNFKILLIGQMGEKKCFHIFHNYEKLNSCSSYYLECPTMSIKLW